MSSPSNYSSINDIHHYPSRQFDPLSAIDRRLLPETWQHLDLKLTHNDNGAFGSTFAFFQTKWTRFPFKHFPFIYCSTGKCRLLPLSIPVTFGSTLFRTGFVLLYPLSPTSLLTPTTCAFSHCSPELKSIYASFTMRLTRYMIHVQIFFFFHPHFPHPPLISLSNIGLDSVFCFSSVLPPHPVSRWDRRGL